MRVTRTKRWTFYLGLMATLSGCVYHVDLAYRPETIHKSPLSTLKPLVLAIQIDDQRRVPSLWRHDDEIDQRHIIGAVWVQAGAYMVQTKQDVILLLHEALKTELENNGHTVRLPADTSLDGTVHVVVKRFWGETIRSMTVVGITGILDANVAILDARQAQIVLRPLISTYSKKQWPPSDSGFTSVLNSALVGFIRDFARDPRLIQALQHLQRESR